MRKQFEVKARINGKVVIDRKIYAIDKYDAVDVFEINHKCYNTGDVVEIVCVEEVE